MRDSQNPRSLKTELRENEGGAILTNFIQIAWRFIYVVIKIFGSFNYFRFLEKLLWEEGAVVYRFRVQHYGMAVCLLDNFFKISSKADIRVPRIRPRIRIRRWRAAALVTDEADWLRAWGAFPEPSKHFIRFDELAVRQPSPAVKLPRV